MTSTPTRTTTVAGTEVRRRKPAHERRREIVTAAADIGLAEGLDSLTLRRVADELGVFPGLVSHYFATVDDLVAEAFAQAARSEIDEVFAVVGRAADPFEGMRAFLHEMIGEERDNLSVMWLDAWQGGRRRPALQAAVVEQMRAWQRHLHDLVAAGVAAGTFRDVDPQATSIRILALIDGLSIQAVMREAVDYDVVRDLVTTTAEHELGLPRGSLTS